jgi:hypothetical protein
MASLIRRVPPNCCQASRRRRRPRHPRRFSRPSAIRRTYRTPSSMMTSLIKRAICPIGRLRPQSSTCALAHSGFTQATRRRGKAGSSSISRCHSRAASDGRRAAGTVGAVLGTDVATACWRRSGHRRGRRTACRRRTGHRRGRQMACRRRNGHRRGRRMACGCALTRNCACALVRDKCDPLYNISVWGRGRSCLLTRVVYRFCDPRAMCTAPRSVRPDKLEIRS